MQQYRIIDRGVLVQATSPRSSSSRRTRRKLLPHPSDVLPRPLLHLMTERTSSFAFFDIGPLSKGHALVIPKCTSLPHTLPPSLPPPLLMLTIRGTDHAAKLHELPDEHLTELLPIVKKIAIAVGSVDYNVLQVSPQMLESGMWER
jgi:hypothetical protein